MANIALAKAVKKAVTEKPEHWDQQRWAAVPRSKVTNPSDFEEGEGMEITCGTTMCIAGWVCHLAGERIEWGNAEKLTDGQLAAWFLKSGKAIETRAIELLDISFDDATRLFYSLNEEEALDHLDQIIECGEIYDPYRVADSEE